MKLLNEFNRVVLIWLLVVFIDSKGDELPWLLLKFAFRESSLTHVDIIIPGNHDAIDVRSLRYPKRIASYWDRGHRLDKVPFIRLQEKCGLDYELSIFVHFDCTLSFEVIQVNYWRSVQSQPERIDIDFLVKLNDEWFKSSISI